MEFLSIALTVVNDVSPGRLIETLIALVVIWSRVKPFLTKYDQRLANLEKAVSDGFKNGETRFQNIENRVSVLEQKVNLPDNNGSNQGVGNGKTV